MMQKVSIAILATAILAAVLFMVFHPLRRTQPSITGIGVALTAMGNTLEIMQVLPNTPAAKAGLHRGLLIQEIDGANVAGKPLAMCVAMTRGPVGSTVQLEIIDPANHQTNLVQFTRENIPVPVGPGRMNVLPVAH